MSLLRFLENLILRSISTGKSLPIQIDITNACNLNCSHCYHSHHRNEGALGLDEWKTILDQYFALIQRLKYKPMIIICGGEPTISPNFGHILRYIGFLDSSAEIVILSNGTRLTDKIIESVLQFENLSFQISLDGPDQLRHDMIRGIGSFGLTMKGISKLKENKIQFSLLAVLSKRSADWIEDFFQLAKKIQPTNMNFTRMIENGHAKKLRAESADRALLPLELKAAFYEIISCSAEFVIKTRTEAPLFNLLHPGLGRNGRFWEALVVDYQGNLVASSRSRIIIGNVLKDGLESLFLNSPLFRKLRKGEIEVCGTCKHLKFCGGDRNAAFAGNNNFLGADPGCWLGIK